MRKLVFIIICLFVMSWQVVAQRDTILSNHHEITFSFGIIPQKIYLFSSSFNKNELFKSISMGYSYRFNKVIGVGALYSYVPNFYTIFYQSYSGSEEIIGRMNQSSHSFVSVLKINWLNTKYVVLFSKIGIGFTLLQHTLTNYYPEKYEGAIACTGCGRCIRYCPVSVDISEIVGYLKDPNADPAKWAAEKKDAKN